MAKDYHPLDSRYKGPSTAYTGAPKRKVVSAPPPAPSGPWQHAATGTPAAPPPLPQQSHRAVPDGPPALPTGRARAPRKRRSGMRVLIGLLIMGIIVGGNLLVGRQYWSLINGIEMQLNAVEL